MTLPKLKDYTVLRDVGAITISEIARLTQHGMVFVGIAGKVYEAKEVSE